VRILIWHFSRETLGSLKFGRLKWAQMLFREDLFFSKCVACASKKRTYVLLGMPPVYTQLFGAMARTAHLQNWGGRLTPYPETKKNQRISFGCLDISLTAIFADRLAYLSSHGSGISRTLIMCGCTVLTSNLNLPTEERVEPRGCRPVTRGRGGSGRA